MLSDFAKSRDQTVPKPVQTAPTESETFLADLEGTLERLIERGQALRVELEEVETMRDACQGALAAARERQDCGNMQTPFDPAAERGAG